MGNTTSDKKQSFKKCIIIGVIVLITLLFAILLPCFLLGLNDIPVPSPYKDELINLANREYKEKENMQNDEVYVSSISSLIYMEDSNELLYTASTDLDSDNCMIVITIETPAAYSLESALVEVSPVEDIITGYTVEFYSKIDTVDKNLSNYLDLYTNNKTIKTLDVGVAKNPNILHVSMSFYSANDTLTSLYAEYDVQNNEFISETIHTQIHQSDTISILS